MSTWLRYILIEGYHLADIDQFFMIFGYTKCTPHIDDLHCNTINQNYSGNTEHFFINTLKNWTVIHDAPLNIVDISDDKDRLQRLIVASSTLKTRILTIQTQDITGVYQFFIVDNGNLVRGFVSSDGVIEQNYGEPLPIESELKFKMVVWHDDMFEIIKSVTGISLDDLNKSDYTLKTYNSEQIYL